MLRLLHLTSTQEKLYESLWDSSCLNEFELVKNALSSYRTIFIKKPTKSEPLHSVYTTVIYQYPLYGFKRNIEQYFSEKQNTAVFIP